MTTVEDIEDIKRGYRTQMMKICREIELFEEVTEQRLADQARVIRTNTWLSEVD